MSIRGEQLRDVVVVPTIAMLEMHSPAAVNLLLGTAAQESAMGKFLVQQEIGYKGGIGIYQMEAITFHHTWNQCVESRPAMRHKVHSLLGYAKKPDPTRLASDLMLATAMARLYYSTFPELLPAPDDIKGLAAYWKMRWNTRMGKGTEQQFMENYKLYVKNSKGHVY